MPSRSSSSPTVFRVSGSICANCGRLEPRALDTCPSCGAQMERAKDLVLVAMERARNQSGSVEVVHGDAAQRLMEMGQGLAALLRYPAPM
jgi:peptide subunit release factor 1 (eRF1)